MYLLIREHTPFLKQFCQDSKHESPQSLWQIEGGNVEAITDLIFLGSKITVYGDHPHEIKREVAP